ncbi:MAG: hypothetical protein J0L84_20000 [Verrucomicrobia bacterium]|nr:hypothetical protein [Verrucomicrobiota bacterium]
MNVPVLASAWTAFLLWILGEVVLARRAGPSPWRVRMIWPCGALALTIHLLVAFALVHGWSHRSAVASTALRMHQEFGVSWGGGVFINYLLVGWWWCDAAYSWWRPQRWNQPGRYRSLRRACFWFLWFNGTVVFASGIRRIWAAALCLALLGIWWRGTRESRQVAA